MNAQGEKQGKKIKNNDSDRQLVSEIAEFLLYNVSAKRWFKKKYIQTQGIILTTWRESYGKKNQLEKK